jgi:hypothetical protein
VGWPQLVIGILLVVLLCGLAVYYAWRQRRLLIELRSSDQPEEEQTFFRRQAYRRLVNSVLLFILAGQLLGALVFLEDYAQRLANLRNAQPRGTPLTPEQRDFAWFYSWYWITFLLILLAVVILAAVDFWATRRFGQAQHQKINQERTQMLESQLNRLRQERNGHPRG